MSKRYARFLTAVFCLFLGGLMVWQFLLPDRDRSDVENRTLQQRPGADAVRRAGRQLHGGRGVLRPGPVPPAGPVDGPEGPDGAAHRQAAVQQHLPLRGRDPDLQGGRSRRRPGGDEPGVRHPAGGEHGRPRVPGADPLGGGGVAGQAALRRGVLGPERLSRPGGGDGPAPDRLFRRPHRPRLGAHLLPDGPPLDLSRRLLRGQCPAGSTGERAIKGRGLYTGDRQRGLQRHPLLPVRHPLADAGHHGVLGGGGRPHRHLLALRLPGGRPAV